ncbi:MAG: ion channel [Pseudomonadota bacterium]
MRLTTLQQVKNRWRILEGKHRFGLLFFSLLLTIGGSTLLAELKLNRIHEILILLNQLVLLSIIKGRWTFRASVLLFSLSLVSTAIFTVTGIKALVIGDQISTVFLLILGTHACFRFVFESGRIDEERIFASLSLYLLFGVLFALIFAVIDEFMPGSFHYPNAISPDTVTRPILQLFYFSFVTLATLGYGDIVPISGPAKGMAILEAVIGQMYLVVVVSRLVSMYGQSESKD